MVFDFKISGYVSFVVVYEGGVLIRKGYIEAVVEFCRIFEFFFAVVMIEILDEKGDSYNKEYVKSLVKRFLIFVIIIDEIEKYILLNWLIV